VNARRLTCAPVDELRHDDVPVRVLLADRGVGTGDKRETLGFDTYTSARAQVTAGIAADGVQAIELVDDHGSHSVDAISNAFLYVAERPEVAAGDAHPGPGSTTAGRSASPSLFLRPAPAAASAARPASPAGRRRTSASSTAERSAGSNGARGARGADRRRAARQDRHVQAPRVRAGS
jgi:hypothetical protein